MHRRAVLTGVAVVAVLALAAGFRFYDIINYPPGLFPDEAANGEDALLILSGDARPFYARGNGREALFFYLQAASLRLFGRGVWQMHIVSGVVGTLTVWAVYAAGRVWFGRLAGVLAALLLATNHWHVTLSRTGFRAIMVPLFVALFTAWVGYAVTGVRRGQRGQSLLYAALAGAALAGGFYTYIAYRMMVAVVLGVAALLLLAALHPKVGFPQARRYALHLLAGTAAAVVVLLPLAGYFGLRPAEFLGRAGQVSVFNEELQRQYGGGTLPGTIFYSLRETVLSFFTGEGDLNWRHTVAGFPLLNPLVGILFLLGWLLTLRGAGLVVIQMIRGQEVHLNMIYLYLLLLLLGMLVPVIATAEGLPHGLRSLGLVVPMFLLAGAAGAVLIHWYQQRWRAASMLGIASGVTAGLLAVGVLYDGALYFGISRNEAAAHYAYRGDLTRVAAWLEEYTARPAGEEGSARPYLVLDEFSLQTPHFLLTVAPHDYQGHPDEAQHRYRAVAPEQSHLVTLAPGEVMVFTQSTMPDADRYREFNPEAGLLASERNRFGEEILRVYRGVPAPAVQGERQDRREARFDLDAS